MIKDVLREIGIMREGTQSPKGSYVIDIEDSDDFGRFYSMLDKNDAVDELEDSNINNNHAINLVYEYKNILINLTADFDADVYKLIATEVGDNGKDEDEDDDEKESQ